MNRQGFTIVELLVVIVIIAILASITIVAYNGITRRAVETSMKADLQNGATALELDGTRDGSYPADAASANGGQGLKASSGNTLSYEPKSYGYCVAVSNPKSSTTFRIKSTTGRIEEGTCVVTVTTLAGSGTASFADGTGTAAQFYYPYDVTVDATGNVYVADNSNQRIRTISASGVVTTLAGSGTQGFADGTGTAAQFKGPRSVAVDASGNVYVADGDNHRVRMITPSGVVTTLAGSGSIGFADGTGTAAHFSYPYGVGADASGNVYVADYGNHRIRKISPSGVVTTLAGSGAQGYADGASTAAKFNNPRGVAADASGNVYVADTGNSRIRKISPSGVVTTLAGSGTNGFADGTGTAAQFNNPYSVAVDASGTVYVVDSGNHRIRTISPSGLVTTLAGSGIAGFADGTSGTARFNMPLGVAVDTSGNVYVADTFNNRIRKIEQ